MSQKSFILRLFLSQNLFGVQIWDAVLIWLAAIAKLLTFPSDSFLTYLSSLTLSVEGGAIAISGTASFYGSFTATIQAA